MGSYTTQMGLYLPTEGESGWADEVNNNFTVLDSHYVDVKEQYGLTIGGGQSAGTQTSNAAALNAAIADHINGTGAMLLLPPGVIEVNDTIGYAATADFSAKLTIRGQGRRYTFIRQMTADIPTMQFGISTEVDGNGDYLYYGNFRDLTLEHFALRGETSDDAANTPNLQLDKAGYCVFQDLTLWQGAGVKTTRQCFDLILTNCWWLNTVGHAVEVGHGGALTICDSTLGEDAGAIVVTGGALYMDNCEVRQAHNKVDADGFDDRGPEMFRVTGYGTLNVSGSRLTTGEASVRPIFCALDSPRGVRFVNNAINVNAYTEEMFSVDRTVAYQNIEVKQNRFRLASTALSPAPVKFVERHATQYAMYGLQVHGNRFLIGTNRDMTVDDACLIPNPSNSFADNTFYRGTQA